MLAASAYALNPDPPRSLEAVPGDEDPVIARLSWSPPEHGATTAYAVYLALAPDGPYALVGSTSTTYFVLRDGDVGRAYWFRVTSLDEDGNESTPAQAGPVITTWLASPHRMPASGSRCRKCHQFHGTQARMNMRAAGQATPAAEQADACYACHDGHLPTAADIRSGPSDSFALASGHALDGEGGDNPLVQSCASCHEIHGSTSNLRMLPAPLVNGTAVSSSGPPWCYACHDAANSWYGPDYPEPGSPSRDASGYPVAGTWPGEDVYASATNAHRLIPQTLHVGSSTEIARAQGDCLYCHAAHRGSNRFDSLVATFLPPAEETLVLDQTEGAYAAVCFKCHGGATPSGLETRPADIKRFVTGSDPNAGHRVISAGGLLPPGSPLPCYECHGPHGSARGNASMISDALGTGLSTSSARGVRAFCFQCHTTSDGGLGWDSVEGAYAEVASGAKVVGLARDSGRLRLPATEGHAEADTASCYDCHGSDYDDGGHNVHDPGAGANHYAKVSQECVDCHGSANVTVVHTAGGCATCHDNPAYPALPAGKIPECVSCHNGTTVGTHAYSPIEDNHYDEATHTASPFTADAQGIGADGIVPAGSVECSACHSDTLATAHSATSTSAGSVTCVECHTDTTLGSVDVVAGDWPEDRCTDCHDAGDASTHDDYGWAHSVDPGTCAGTDSACHRSTDLVELHAANQWGGAPLYSSCGNADAADPSSCHDVRDARPLPVNPSAPCGLGTSGCHQDTSVSNHAVTTAHSFGGASDYSNSTVTGCTNSGAGCHGSESAYTSFVPYHPESGCVDGACHQSSSNEDYAGGGDCATCHDSNYAGAPDVVGLASAAPDGHYAETSHTAGALATALTAGGTASATCADCHDPVGAEGLGGLHEQHQGLAAPHADTTCYDCHNANVNVTRIVTGGWIERLCIDCHNAEALPGLEQHLATPPPVAATAVGAYEGISCAEGVCHGTTELHELHKDAESCGLSGCHDFDRQAAIPNSTSCGIEGACHTGAEPHPGVAAAHDAGSEPMAEPGSNESYAVVTAAIENQSFPTDAWPGDWVRSDTTYVHVQNVPERTHGTYAAEVWTNRGNSRRTADFYKDFDLTAYASAKLVFWDYAVGLDPTGDYTRVDYSTDGGATWTRLRDSSVDSGWTERTFALPAGTTVRIRFGGSVNTPSEYCDWDDIVVTAVRSVISRTPLAPLSTARASCQDNPNGLECHVVTDVAALHAGTSGGCFGCHGQDVPVKDCQSAGCHASPYVNRDRHDDERHATVFGSNALGAAFEGTGIQPSWCSGCHDDGIDDEHEVIAAYRATPCSICHKKSLPSGPPTNMAVADAAAAIEKPAGTALCDDCHRTVTKTSVHVQRRGSGGAGGTQFGETWSGHRVYDTMGGSLSNLGVVGGVTVDNWQLPAVGSWLLSGWQSPSAAVRCYECHGTTSGTARPHESTPTVNTLTGYDLSYGLGTLYVNSSAAMSNTTNLCVRCHAADLSANNVHTRGNHQGPTNGRCTNCHTPVPHGWVRPRLLGYTSDPESYRTIEVEGITARNHTPTGWADEYCDTAGCHDRAETPVWP